MKLKPITIIIQPILKISGKGKNINFSLSYEASLQFDEKEVIVSGENSLKRISEFLNGSKDDAESDESV